MFESMPVLLPCPFCGFTYPELAEDETSEIYCTCPACDAQGPRRDDDRKAVKAWNKRIVRASDDKTPENGGQER